MPSSIIARRYAKALFDLALEMNIVEEVKADMELLRSVCETNKDFVQLLKSPIIRPVKKQKVMVVLFGDKISEVSLRYLDIITRKRREQYLEHIALEYIENYKKFKNIVTVYFESAETISERIRSQVIALLEDQTKGTIELKESVKKELIGGFVVNYDDKKYDASILYQLKKLKKNTAEINFYIREF